VSDWQAGDLAMCVIDGGWFGHIHGSLPSIFPEKNAVYRVVKVRPRDQITFLYFAEIDGKGWNAAAFRKIRPDEHEACEPEFVTLLKRSKKQRALNLELPRQRSQAA
jgi:hypothetical protein